MHKRAHTSSLGLAVLVSGISAAATQIARADDASATAPSASTLQEVVVTAQKREERLFDVPMGVTAITSEQLQSQQIVSLADLESRVAGLSLTNIQPGQTRLTLRGQNAGGVGSTSMTRRSARATRSPTDFISPAISTPGTWRVSRYCGVPRAPCTALAAKAV